MNILVLHGWGGSSKSWLKVKELLEQKGSKVFVPDLPGFGEEPEPPKPWSGIDYLDWVKKYSEKEGLSQFFLLGHSFGGGLSISFASLYPEKILGLILVDSARVGMKKNLSIRQKIIIKFKRSVIFYLPHRFLKYSIHFCVRSLIFLLAREIII